MNMLYKTIENVDVFFEHTISEESFVSEVRFYHIKDDGAKQYFKCRYHTEAQSENTPLTEEVEKELEKMIINEISMEIKNGIDDTKGEYKVFEKINNRCVAWSIEHNDHNLAYQTVKEYIEDTPIIGELFVSKEQKELAIERDEIWHLCFYPDTPIGSVSVYAADFGALLEYIRNEF